MSLTPAQIAARILIETDAILFRPDEPFIFTSGRASPVYTDCRKLIAFPRARRRLMEMGADADRGDGRVREASTWWQAVKPRAFPSPPGWPTG